MNVVNFEILTTFILLTDFFNIYLRSLRKQMCNVIFWFLLIRKLPAKSVTSIHLHGVMMQFESFG